MSQTERKDGEEWWRVVVHDPPLFVFSVPPNGMMEMLSLTDGAQQNISRVYDSNDNQSRWSSVAARRCQQEKIMVHVQMNLNHQ